MRKAKILLVEDEEDLRELLAWQLDQAGYEILQAADGEEGLQMASQEGVDLILLDWMLPLRSGPDLCRLLRQRPATKDLPILMLTAKSADQDVVRGLDVGADDYITKPYHLEILKSRIKALLRRTQSNESSLLTWRELELDSERMEARLRKEPLKLTLSEFRLLELLLKRPHQVFTRDQLIDALHGQDHFTTDRAVDVQIVGLRKKLGDHSEMIATVRGVGYKLKEL